MSSLRVIKPGMFTTVQDLGRFGSCAIGVPPSGAADPLSLIIGNRLLDNEDNAAALEATLVGPSVTLERSAWICLTGADCPDACIMNGGVRRPLTAGVPTHIDAGEQVSVGAMTELARAYLCISGGVDVPQVLRSRSTFAPAALGGLHGRALRAGDTLPLTGISRAARTVPDHVLSWLREQIARRRLRVVPSLHTDRFPAGALDRLASTLFTVQTQSDRIGIRLAGHRVPLPDHSGLFDSEPTVTGGIQITGDAQPIILGVDRPTTGGYPLLACVIAADLPAAAMLRPRDGVRFEPTSMEAARRLAAEQRETLDTLLPPSTGTPAS